LITRRYFLTNIVACLLKARIVKAAETAVASERLCKHASNDRKWFSSRYMIAATDTHVIMEEIFSVRSVLGLYNKDQLPVRDSPELAVRGVGGSCVSLAAEERPLLGDVTKQRSENRDLEH
jgi:hypothetical protein